MYLKPHPPIEAPPTTHILLVVFSRLYALLFPHLVLEWVGYLLSLRSSVVFQFCVCEFHSPIKEALFTHCCIHLHITGEFPCGITFGLFSLLGGIELN